jgi:adenylosuccinate lyase
MSREDAYLAVQRNAMRVWEKGEDFKSALAADRDVSTHLDSANLDELFDMAYHTKHVATIFKRVFGEA